jgi:hypothetical protein
MKEANLEEEALRLFVRGHDLTVHRQTMADNVDEVTLTMPSGKGGACGQIDRAPAIAAGQVDLPLGVGPSLFSAFTRFRPPSVGHSSSVASFKCDNVLYHILESSWRVVLFRLPSPDRRS